MRKIGALGAPGAKSPLTWKKRYFQPSSPAASETDTVTDWSRSETADKVTIPASEADLLTRKIELRPTGLQMRYDLDEEEDDDRVLTDEYNDLTNVVRAGRLDEAETRAKALSARFPHAPHGLEALGYAYETRGDLKLAAQCYRKAAVLNSPDGVDDHRTWLLRLADKIDPPA